MNRKRGKKQKAVVAPIPDDVLAEGSGPITRVDANAIAIATVEDVGTTADIATTDDVVTADDVVATSDAVRGPEPLVPDRGDGQSAATDGYGAIDAPGPVGPDPADATDADAMYRAAAIAGEVGLDAATGSRMRGGGAHGDAEGSGEDGIDSGEDVIEGGDDILERGEDGGDADADDAIVFPTSAATMDAVQLKHLVEALIFASDRPLTVQRLRQLTRVGDVRRLEQALAELSEDYRERGLILQQVSGGYQFRTRTQFSAWVQQLIAGRPVRLSRAQLETLAIIAYRQPITRPEIDDIRGVDSSATLKLLIDRMLIRVLGKREEVGRPILYGTTKEFLDFFSLGDLRELPTLREYSELTAESRKVMSDRLGIAPEASDGSDKNDGDDGGGENGGGDNGGGNGSGNGGGGVMPGFGNGTISGDDPMSGADDGTPAGDGNAMASSDDAMSGLGDTMSGLGDDAMSGLGDDAMSGLGDDAMSGLGDDAMSGLGDDATAGLGDDAMSGLGDSMAGDDEAAGPPSGMDLANAIAPFLSPADALDDASGDVEVPARRVESVVE